MTTDETTCAEDQILAELNGPPISSRWARYFGRAFGPCIFLSGVYMLVFRFIPAVIAFALESYYSEALAKNATVLLIFTVALIGCYLGLVTCLAGTLVYWREPWGRSTYRITRRGIMWEVDGEVQAAIPWQEVSGALFYVPPAGLDESEAAKISEYYGGLRILSGLFFSPCTSSDKQSLLESFDPNKRNSLSYPPYHFMLFLRKGELRFYFAPPPTWLLYTSFSRFLFLFDFRVFNGYVSSIHGDYITFGSLFFEQSGLYLLGSRERATVLGKHRRERRRFLLALTHGLIRSGFKPTFK